jgi:hypothetical protein
VSRLATLFLLSLATACVIDPDDEPQLLGPCGGVECSDHGWCDAGECRCDPGYVGDPYAEHGCSRVGACATTCGLNSYCEDGSCVCADGFIAVCSTGDCLAASSICDGVVDCANEADEADDLCATFVVQTWVVSDGCDDGQDVQWRLWSEDGAWVWPNIEEVYVTAGLGARTSETIECLEGETICLGGGADDAAWGVGIDGTMTCDRCCFACTSESIEYGALLCPP